MPISAQAVYRIVCRHSVIGPLEDGREENGRQIGLRSCGRTVRQ